MPGTIVFDIGNVLLAWDMRNLFAKLAPADELDHILEKVCPLSWHATLDGGAAYADAIAQRVALYPRHAALIEAYDPRWQETISKKDQAAGAAAATAAAAAADPMHQALSPTLPLLSDKVM